MTTWPEKHPSWEYKIWTDENLPEIRNRALFDAFRGIYHAQADVLRYEILFQFGGVYADADSECLQPIPIDWLAFENFACRENEHDPPLLMNSFLGATPQSALFGAVLDELAKLDATAIAAEDRDTLYNIAWVLTGPACFSEVAHRDKHSVATLPGFVFASHGEEGEGILARHWLGSTNRSY